MVKAEAGQRLPGLIAERIRHRGHSQVEAGREMSVSGPAVSRWVTGKTYPEDGNYAAIAAYLGITVHELSGIVHEDKMSDASRGLAPTVAQLREDFEELRSEFLGELSELRTMVETIVGTSGEAPQRRAPKAPASRSARSRS